MTGFIIRSMSTTDFRPGTPSVPFHVYLKPMNKRAGAWWSRSLIEAQVFDTIEAAEAEWRRVFSDVLGTQDIAPRDCTIPVWEGRHHVPTKRAA